MSACLTSLFDLCIIRFAYLMWIRHDVTKRCSKEMLFEELVDIVLADVQNLPLPEKMKSRILQLVKPVGKHLLSLLSMWLSKTQPEGSQKWLTGDMLFECLILNPDGLINQRKMAEKLLDSRMLNGVFIFRMACINFLEKEVLKLWPVVKLYFLNKIMLESEQPDPAKEDCFWAKDMAKDIEHNSLNSLNKFPDIYDLLRERDCHPTFPRSTEPYEVLFWIIYCLSKENAIDIVELPNFITNGTCYEFSLEDAALSGNVACFDYFKNYSGKKIEYNNIKMIEKMFRVEEEDLKQACFIFLFLRLNSEEKAEVFRKFPKQAVSHFLQWPLSLTFIENTEELWNLIPNIGKNLIFLKIFAILFPRYCMLPSLQDSFFFNPVFGSRSLVRVTGMYILEHLKSIWVALWEICHNSNKVAVLMSFVLPSIVSFVDASPYPDLRAIFETSGLKEKLIHIFLTNGEAILELYAADDLKESLKSLVAKHLPEDFENLDRIFFSFLDSEPFALMMKSVDMIQLLSEQPLGDSLQRCSNPIDKRFVFFIKDFLFSSHRIDKSFFHY